MESKSLEILAAAALIGLVFEINKGYNAAKPTAEELREAEPDDPQTERKLLDADISIAIPALIAGGAATWIMRSATPLVVTIIALVAIGGYHHTIMARPATRTT